MLVAFAMFPDVKGATSYSVSVDGLLGSADVTGGGPPFPHDRYSITSGNKTVWFVAPAGFHWFPLASGSSGRGCAEGKANVKTHFKIGPATATINTPPPDTTESKPVEPRECPGGLEGPTLGSRGERLVVIRKKGVAEVTANGKTMPLLGNRYVTGKFIVRTGPGEWVKVGEVKPGSNKGEGFLIAPGTTVEFEAGKPMRVLESTPGVSDKAPPRNLEPYDVRTNGCVTSARG